METNIIPYSCRLSLSLYIYIYIYIYIVYSMRVKVIFIAISRIIPILSQKIFRKD